MKWLPFKLTPWLCRSLLALTLCILSVRLCIGQVSESPNSEVPNPFSDAPVKIDAESTRFEGGLAIAEENVVIRSGDATMHCDYAQYNPETHDLLLRGNVRIFQPPDPSKLPGTDKGHVFMGDRAVYNVETKELHAANFRGEFDPFFFSSDSLFSLTENSYQLRGATFTSSDSSKPDYYLRAKSVRVYPKDRIIFSNVTLYVGRTPVFWFPYLWQWLRQDTSFTITPGYTSLWGAFLLSQYTFPLTDTISGQVRLDLRSLRGVAAGFNVKGEYGKNRRDWFKFRSYFAEDNSTDKNVTAFAREKITKQRYRVSLQDRTFITDDIYASIDVNKLSDPLFLQDFEQSEFRINPQPDNVASVTFLQDDYTVTGIVRGQLNNFFDTTERLPELVFDGKRHALFGTPIFYQGETGAAYLRQGFAQGSNLPNYETFRFDTYNQLLYPQTYFGWLSVIPRAGIRETYYSQTGDTQSATVLESVPVTAPGFPPTSVLVPTIKNTVDKRGAILRTTVDAGIESSFKLSRAYEGVQSRLLGLDGLRHVVQPYTDFSFVTTDHNADKILQFDRYEPSDQAKSIEFPQFTSIDSISDWAIWRYGVRNRLETRRDSSTIVWLDLDSYIDLNIKDPNFPGLTQKPGEVSNVYNRLRLNPAPWVTLQVDSQLPVLKTGFTEFNTSANFLVDKDLAVNVGHRYIDGNPFYVNSSEFTFGAFLHLTENWSVSMNEQYEFKQSILEYQQYEVHRDLSSWIATFGIFDRNNGGSTTNEYGVLLSFTLKDAPQVSLPLSFDPYSSTNR